MTYQDKVIDRIHREIKQKQERIAYLELLFQHEQDAGKKLFHQIKIGVTKEFIENLTILRDDIINLLPSYCDEQRKAGNL